MKSSTSFIVVLLSVSAMACAGSSAHTKPTRSARLSSGEGMGSLWMPSEETRAGRDVQVAYRREATSDLWMKKGFESSVDDGRGEPRPRLDSFVGRLTPANSLTFVEASHPARARQ